MLIAVGVILTLVFIGWVIWWAVKRRPVKPHVVMYGLACLAGIFSLAFFLSMDIEDIIKILVSIVLGAVLIFVAAYFQRRQSRKTHQNNN